MSFVTGLLPSFPFSADNQTQDDGFNSEALHEEYTLWLLPPEEAGGRIMGIAIDFQTHARQRILQQRLFIL